MRGPELPQISVPVLPVELVLERARKNEQHRPMSRKRGTRGRMVTNYIRHCLTGYDAALSGCSCLQYLRIKRAVLVEIAHLYPITRGECRRAIRALDRRIQREEAQRAESAPRLILTPSHF